MVAPLTAYVHVGEVRQCEVGHAVVHGLFGTGLGHGHDIHVKAGVLEVALVLATYTPMWLVSGAQESMKVTLVRSLLPDAVLVAESLLCPHAVTLNNMAIALKSAIIVLAM